MPFHLPPQFIPLNLLEHLQLVGARLLIHQIMLYWQVIKAQIIGAFSIEDIEWKIYKLGHKNVVSEKEEIMFGGFSLVAYIQNFPRILLKLISNFKNFTDTYFSCSHGVSIEK